MKLSASLLKSIALGIAVSTFSASCHRDEVKSGISGENKVKKQNKHRANPDKCPACGMG